MVIKVVIVNIKECFIFIYDRDVDWVMWVCNYILLICKVKLVYYNMKVIKVFWFFFLYDGFCKVFLFYCLIMKLLEIVCYVFLGVKNYCVCL